MAQCVAVWSEQAGAAVTYRTFTGVESLPELIAGDWDVVFVSSYTRTAWVAYAIAQALRPSRTQTVLGGPHAHAYPQDAARYFDRVLGQTDQALVAQVIETCGAPVDDPWIEAAAPPRTLPGVRQRARFLRDALKKASFVRVVPILASLGCPYACDFCSDARTPFRRLGLDAVAADVEAAAELFPGALVFFHDPNFGVRFDELLDAVARGKGARRIKFGAESTLSLLSAERAARLGQLGCSVMLPGIESWFDYSAKQGLGRQSGWVRMEETAQRLDALIAHVPYVQVNLILGLEADAGTEAARISEAFVQRSPGSWPNVNLVMAYGVQSPMSQQLAAEGRILPVPMPLLDQKTCSNVCSDRVDPATVFRDAVSLMSAATTFAVSARRVAAARGFRAGVVHLFRAYGADQRRRVRWYQEAAEHLDGDVAFRGFFEGERVPVPDPLRRVLAKRLGRWADWLPDDRRAVLDKGRPRYVET